MNAFFLHRAIATGLGLGYSKKMPGTVGSLAAIFLVLLFWHYVPLSIFSFSLFCLIGILLTILGILSADHYAKAIGNEDPKEVIMDEIAAQWLVFIAPLTLHIYNNNFSLNWYEVALCFVLFRFFDITKPGPIGWCDRNIKGGLGIMLDDALASIASILCFYLIVYAGFIF